MYRPTSPGLFILSKVPFYFTIPTVLFVFLHGFFAGYYSHYQVIFLSMLALVNGRAYSYFSDKEELLRERLSEFENKSSTKHYVLEIQVSPDSQSKCYSDRGERAQDT